jgi:Uma2 family endonuclease
LAPDLAAEILSESNTPAEIDQKLREYFQSGTRLVWVVDPVSRTAAIYRAAGKPERTISEDEMLDGADVIPGFLLRLGDLFTGVPPAA